ncbi:MAG TPA: hypothetical protein DEB40_08740 [Elusimicrobia bacterium]|nr:hypothetical protein [Elusimicrobiota bacterium]HBT61815.1 hypothetical protein [Elusimicrobiota bacterium]
MSIPPQERVAGLVSVVLPTRDRARVVERTIDSVLAQTFRQWELVVVDDGSADDTESVVRSYRDDRIRYSRRDGPHGVSRARNRGLELARGEFIAFHDAGDEWLPNKLELQVALLKSLPAEVGMVYCAMTRVRLDGTLTPFPASVVSARDSDVYRRALSLDVIIGPPTCLLRAAVFDAVGGFDERLFAREDLDLFIRISAAFRLQRVEGSLTRFYDDSMGVSRDYERIIRAHKRILVKHKGAFKDDRGLLVPHWRVFADARFLLGNRSGAVRMRLRVLASGKSRPSDWLWLLVVLAGMPAYRSLQAVWGACRRIQARLTRPSAGRLRIAYLAPESDLFGSELSLLAAVKHLDPSAFDARLLTVAAGPLEEAARAQGVAVERLPWLADMRRRPWLLPVAALRLRRRLRCQRIDLLEIQRTEYPLILAAWLATAWAGTRLVLREHMHEPRALDGPRRFLISRADRVLAVTRGAVASWRDGAPAWWRRYLDRRLVIIPSGRDIGLLSGLAKDRALARALGVPDDARLAGMVAALDPCKRPEIFLRAARLVLDRCPGAWFLVVGSAYSSERVRLAGYEDSLRRLAAELGLAGRVIFTGYREDAYRLIQNLDVLCLPSEREALGGVLIEAMAAGVPVVASAVGGLPEIVVHGETGMLVASADPQDYAAAMLAVLGDAKLSSRMREAGLRRAWMYDLDGLSRRTEAVYRELC